MSRDLSNGSLKTGRQRAENLHRDKYQKDLSEVSQEDRQQISYIGMSRKTERGEEKKRGTAEI